jgi:hypothetical protein
MKLEQFDKFLEGILGEVKGVLGSKSADYAGDGDKLYNFKLQARIEGITPVEALRGNWLKHRSSIQQGLDELQTGKMRDLKWWHEKLIDSVNYEILLLALLTEEFGD